METFSALLALCAGIHRSPVNSPHRGQWRGALMFLWSAPWMKGWVNNRKAGDLRRNRARYDVIFITLRPYLWDKRKYMASPEGMLHWIIDNLILDGTCTLAGTFNSSLRIYVPSFPKYIMSESHEYFDIFFYLKGNVLFNIKLSWKDLYWNIVYIIYRHVFCVQIMLCIKVTSLERDGDPHHRQLGCVFTNCSDVHKRNY